MASDLRVWRKILSTVARGGAAVNVGVMDGDLADIAAANEYGTEHIPERSFFRSTFRDKRAELASLQAKIAAAVLEGRIDVARGAALVGAWAAGAIKATITRDGHFAPLAPATIARKHSDKPLIETSRLVNGITWVVVD